jgi:hypothetical protein
VPALPPRQGFFCPLFSNVVGEKKRKDKVKNMTFWLEIKVATQGVSLWYFHVCITTPLGLSPLIFFILP